MQTNKSNNRDTFIKESETFFESYCSSLKTDINISKEYRKSLLQKYTKIYEEDLESIKKYSSEQLIKQLLADKIKNRKIEATVDVAIQLSKQFKDKYPELSIENEFLNYCKSPSSPNMDCMDDEAFLTLACAIFILDSIVKSGNYNEAIFFIPRNEETEKIPLPDRFRDSVFTNEVIKGVIYLIKNRYGTDETFYNQYTANITSDMNKPLQYCKYSLNQDYEKLYELSSKMTIKEKYDTLLSFIRPEIIDRAIQRYKEQYYALIETMLEIADKCRRSCREISLKALDELRRMKKQQDTVNNLRSSVLNNNTIKTGFPFAMTAVNKQNNFSELESGNYMIDDHIFVVNKYKRKIKKEELDHLYKFQDLLYSLVWEGRKSDNPRIEELKDNLFNPYEIIFAYLYLLDHGDNIVWVPEIANHAYAYAMQLLPWDMKSNRIIEKIGEKEFYDIVRKETESMSEKVKTVDDDRESYITDYKLIYNDRYRWERINNDIPEEEQLMPLNLTHFIYYDSGMLPPRFYTTYFDEISALENSGLSNDAAYILRQFQNFSNAIQNKYSFDIVINTEKTIKEKERVISELDDLSTNELKALIKRKDSEISMLKESLRKTEIKERNLDIKVTEIQDEASSDKQELIELRELIYKIQNGSVDEEEVQESSISFPYRTKAKVVVYGGHATWLKVIVKLLPNVKFIDPYADPDVNTIRNADVVWMQTNAMPHNKYNKIMEIVRMKKIPVKYFAYASAEKCALQLAEYDTSR